MPRARALACLIGVLCLATGALTEQRPNFSGRWVIVSPPQGAGQEQVITHDDKTLSTAHASEGTGRSMIHQLDGIERRNAIAMRGQEIVMLSKAAWDGNTVVITTATSYPNGMKTQAKETWSIDTEGRLIVDFTETAEGQPPRSFKVIHTKKN